MARTPDPTPKTAQAPARRPENDPEWPASHYAGPNATLWVREFLAWHDA